MTYSELQSDARFLTQTDSNSFTDAELNRSFNEWQHRVANQMWEASSDWEWNDTSRDKMPIAFANLNDGQAKYRLPNTVFRIDRIEIKDDDGDYHPIEEITKEDISPALTEFREDDGFPQYYDLIDDVLTLYPAPASDDVTESEGLKLYVAREPEDFTTSDTREPGFPRQFHRILSLGAAMDFCVANNLDNKEVEIRRLLYGDQTVDGLFPELEKAIGTRKLGKKTKFKPAFKRSSYE